MLIELKKIDKIYRSGQQSFQALKNVDLSVKEGEMLAIQGKSGAGKSTLLHIIGCVHTFDKGSYILDGIDVGKLNDRQLSKIRNQKMGFVMQDFALVPKMSVYENIAIPLYLSKSIRFKDIRDKVTKTAEDVGLSSQLDKRANQLSGGQKQRVAIARAVVNSPKIILADEPTGALDAATASEIIALLKKQNEKGITVIIITHDDSVAESCGRIIRIQDGKVSFPSKTTC